MIASRQEFYFQAPELLTARQRVRDTLITAMMWLFYLYLWVPLITLMAWLLGFEFAYDVMVRSGGASELAHVLVLYLIIVGIIFCVVSVWSMLNRARFRNRQRRRAAPPVTTEQISSYFGIDATLVTRLRSQKTIEVEFDENGNVNV